MSAAVGLWVMIAPAALGYSGTTAAKLAWLVGPLVFTFAWVALSGVLRALQWANVALGLALAIGGLAVAAGSLDAVNHLACGVLVALLSIRRGARRHSYGGGWRALVSA